MNKLIIAAIIVLLYVLLLQTAPNVSDVFEVLQLSLDQFHGELLFEKKPIVITDKVVEPLSLLSTLFKYTYLYKHFDQQNTATYDTMMPNKAQYCIFTPTCDEAAVIIEHPNIKKFDSNLEIVLQRHQVLVLPFKWRYKVKQGTLNLIHLHTILSCICS
jgi:hypothetical protein